MLLGSSDCFHADVNHSLLMVSAERNVGFLFAIVKEKVAFVSKVALFTFCSTEKQECAATSNSTIFFVVNAVG